MLGHINRDLVPIKAHYFFYNAATGPIVPFLPLIARQLGFSGFLVGTIYTILPISGLIAKPLFGGLADRFRLHKSFFIGFQIVLAIAFFTINFIPPVEQDTKVIVICDNGASAFLEICYNRKLRKSEELKSLKNATEVALSKKDLQECNLSCRASQITYKDLCDSWHITKYCNVDNQTVIDDDIIDFEAQLNKPDYYDLSMKSPGTHFDDAFYKSGLDDCITVRILDIRIDGQVHKAYCQGNLHRINCEAWCPKCQPMDNLLKYIKDNDKSKAADRSTYQFYLFVWAAVISWVGMAVVVSIGDALCFDQLGDGRSKDYGKQKMWGSIGFGIFGISGGYLVDVFSRGEQAMDYSVIFYIMLLAMILDVAVSTRLKNSSIDKTNDPSVLWELSSIAREGRVLVFAWWCIGAGICTGVIWNFLFWYTEELSLDTKVQRLKTLQGLMTGVQCFLGEMPFNFISGMILKKIGHINVMSLVLLVYAIRFMAYSAISNPWLFLAIEILHGPSLGLCWPTMVSYGDKVAPSGTKATIQGLIGAIFEGIGVSIGSLLCGYLMDEFKGIIAFRVFSVGALIWLSIFWLLQIGLQKAKAYPQQHGHTHLASYYPPDDALFMTTTQEINPY